MNEFVYTATTNQEDSKIMNVEIKQQFDKEELKRRLDNYYKIKVSNA